MIRRFGIEIPAGIDKVLQSMTGLYQLLPWRTEPVDRPDGIAPSKPSGKDNALEWLDQHLASFRTPAFWQEKIDPDRLASRFEWGKSIDTSFFNDRTTIILGDQPTAGGVKFDGDRLVEDKDFGTWGDGTVPDVWARLPGVSRVFRAGGASHMMLPTTLPVIAAVRDVLAGRMPRIQAALGATAPDVPVLALPQAVSPPQKPVFVVRAVGGLKMGGAAEVSLRTAQAGDVPLKPPQHRRLRVFSFDPLQGTNLQELGTEQITLELPWDFANGNGLKPGPIGEYVEVIDYDPANRCFYAPVDLDHQYLLAQDGFPLSEGDPRFHQQMVYAVAMNTIHEFQTALGRVALWSPHLERDAQGEVIPSPKPDDEFVPRLRIYPHALQEANSFYHPDKKALLFGYFPAQGHDVGGNLPGGTIFTCLSYDIVAHETTHALLDGIHRYFVKSSNPDVLAFHEALADMVALLQHFSHPEVLYRQLARTRGNLGGESSLGVLARQFGEAIGDRGALRQYLGRKDADGAWKPLQPDADAIRSQHEPHARGAILVAALFRAFMNIFDNRVQDLRRIATGGSGIFPDGDLHPDVVGRLADEAAKSARHMLAMCIRALDYVPPVDITFGEYLRALITADYDLVRDDDRRYRVSVVSAFRDWRIYPSDVRSLSVESLLWSPPEIGVLSGLGDLLANSRLADWDLGCDRQAVYKQMRSLNALLHAWIKQKANTRVTETFSPEWDRLLGLALDPKTAPKSIARAPDGAVTFEVHSARPCRRIGPDGQEQTDVVVEIIQRRKAFFDQKTQEDVDQGTRDSTSVKQDFWFRGGCSLILDLKTGEIRYCIRKAICKSMQKPWEDDRLIGERQFRQSQYGGSGGNAYFDDAYQGNPFAYLHRKK
jgi:hypothetical protein